MFGVDGRKDWLLIVKWLRQDSNTNKVSATQECRSKTNN